MWSEKTKQREKVTWTQLGVVFVERLFNFFAITLVLSFLIHHDYKPFEDTVDFTSLTLTTDLLSLGNFCNSYLTTCESIQNIHALESASVVVQTAQYTHLLPHLVIM